MNFVVFPPKRLYSLCKGFHTMLKEARQKAIAAFVRERSFATLHELMQLTNSSESTIRADLVEMDKDGRILRLRGGAQSPNFDSSSFEMTVTDKSRLAVGAKRKIGAFAASLIQNRSIVYIDAGTTTAAVLDFLSAKDVVFVTNSTSIGRRLTELGYETYLTGGKMKLSTDAYVGSYALDSLSRFHFDLGFFGANGVDLNEGVTTPEYEESIMKKSAIARCKKAYILADSSKFGLVSACRFAELDKVEIITDKTPEEYQRSTIKEVKA